jgi:hypothetical protein
MIPVPAAQVRNTRNAADFTERSHPRSSPEAYKRHATLWVHFVVLGSAKGRLYLA